MLTNTLLCISVLISELWWTQRAVKPLSEDSFDSRIADPNLAMNIIEIPQLCHLETLKHDTRIEQNREGT